MLNASFIIALIVLAIIGYLMGFARVLKLFTSGIFGIIISIIACAMLGGAIQNIGFVGNFIQNINQKAADAWSFLKYLQLGYVAYYVLLFIAVQIIRRLIIRLIKSVFESRNRALKIVNSAVGAVFAVGFCFALLLLFLAGIEVIDETKFAIDFLAKIDNSFIMTLYINNPISFII